jgi:hypothetical protein
VDQEEFETRLREVAVLKQVKLARDPQGSTWVDAEPATELAIQHVLPQTRACEYCDRTCTGCMNHAHVLNKKTYRRDWVTQCDTCKRKVDLETKQVIVPPATGVNYVSKGIRMPKPGNRLGRPRKDFWNEPVQIFTEEQARDHYLKRADLLDRLETLRKSTKDDK